MSALEYLASWIAYIAAMLGLGVALTLGCGAQDPEALVPYECTVRGKRATLAHWIALCLDESTRTAQECEAFAVRQAEQDAAADGCERWRMPPVKERGP